MATRKSPTLTKVVSQWFFANQFGQDTNAEPSVVDNRIDTITPTQSAISKPNFVNARRLRAFDTSVDQGMWITAITFGNSQRGFLP